MSNQQIYTFNTLAEIDGFQGKNLNAQVEAFNIWPDYILADTINQQYWERLYSEFPEYQFFLMDGDKVVGNGNCVPLHLSKEENANLPDGGWDWALEKAFLDSEKGIEPNALCALQIGLNKEYQGKGISSQLVVCMKDIALSKIFMSFILPIRPNQKSQFPLIPMESYIQWTNEIGLPYDAWIRTHVKNGAEVVKVCKRSMYVSENIKEWERWSNLRFQSTGDYILPFLLNPIRIDLNTQNGMYVEPNVWMRYSL